jgi:hypothetical protein
MKVFSKFALALMLGSVAVAPAAYAKKAKEAKPAEPANTAPKLKPSKAFMAAYSPAVDALDKKKDLALAKSLYPALIAAATTDDDRYAAGTFALNLGSQSKDIALQKEGIDLLLASSLMPAASRPVLIFQKGAFAYDAKDYANAEILMKQAFDAGHNPANTAILISNALSQQKKYPEAITWLRRGIDATISAGQKPEASWYAQGANYALKAKDNVASNIWLKDLVRADPQPKYWHDALSIFARGTNLDLQENLDLMRLMRLANAMNYEQDYGLYIESADARRYPAEVLVVLEEGFAKGTIARKNVTFSEAYTIAQGLAAEDKRTLGATEAPARASANGYQAVLAGDAFLSHGNYTKAKELYELAISKGKLVDKAGADQSGRVLTRLGIAKVALNDLAGAKADFAKIQSGNRKGIAEYWMIYIDKKMQPASAPAPAPATPAAK